MATYYPQPNPESPVSGPRRVPAGRGIGWLIEAWALFQSQPWSWIGALLLCYGILLLVGVVPLIGSLATIVLNPLLFAGLMIGARLQDGGSPFRVAMLFAGFERAPGPLAAAGGLYLAGGVAIVLLLLLLSLAVLIPLGILDSLGQTMGMLMTMEPTESNVLALAQADDPWLVMGLLVFILLATLPFAALAMAALFVPALVALDGVPVLPAFWMSFLGCLRNLLPFLVFGLAALLLFSLLLILGLLTWFIGFIAGLLILTPVLTIALYAAYRDIYADDPARASRSCISI